LSIGKSKEGSSENQSEPKREGRALEGTTGAIATTILPAKTPPGI
jgi:hypothetical protein